MKKYYVFLDESGDFDKDLDEKKNLNPSLVGGFFWKKEDIKDNKIFENKLAKYIGRDNHATDMTSESKGEKVFNILTELKKSPVEFVIFQNDIKKKIVNSTQTYLTVLTEGLIQLMKALVISENDTIELSVVAGFKKDTTLPVTNSYVEGYISLSEYQKG